MNTRRPSLLARYQAKISELENSLRIEKDQNLSLKTENQALCEKVEAQHQEEPDCDICDLEHELAWTCDEVTQLQNLLKNEIAAPKWCAKFGKKGLAEEYNLMVCLVQMAIVSKEYDSAIAAYNLAECRATNIEVSITEVVEQLDALIAARPEIDSRCLKFINKVKDAAANPA